MSLQRKIYSHPGGGNKLVGMRNPPRRAAICFSGGGSRAYVAALGQMRALQELGLLGSFGHISAVSGGAWAGASMLAAPDRLAPLSPPEELDWAALSELPAGALHGSVARSSLTRRLVAGLASGLSPYEAWRAAVFATVVRPLGLPAGASFASGSGGAEALPALSIGATLLGRARLAPFELAQRAFCGLEISATYVRISWHGMLMTV